VVSVIPQSRSTVKGVHMDIDQERMERWTRATRISEAMVRLNKSNTIVHAGISNFLNGSVSYVAALEAIIDGLVEQNDEMTKTITDYWRYNSSPIQIIQP